MGRTLRGLLSAALLSALAVAIGCSSDSPTPTSPPPPTGSGTLVLQLSPANPSPKAGTCTLIEAFATFNGSAVPDGTTIDFSTEGGAFGQNGNPTISLVTLSGAAGATLCSSTEGIAVVTGRISYKGKTDQKLVQVQFTPNGLPQGPFISQCAVPSFGPATGGTIVDIRGGGFGTNPSAVKVYFRYGSTVKQVVVNAVTDSDITILTPAIPGLPQNAAATVEVDVVLLASAVTLTSPNCFTYTAGGAFISQCAVPSFGSPKGGTAVTIEGGGFGTDASKIEVFFRHNGTSVQATVLGVTDTAISIVTPAFPGLPTGTATKVDIDVVIGTTTTLHSADCFTYTAVQPTITQCAVPSSGPPTGGTTVDIIGENFGTSLAAVQVFFKNGATSVPATVNGVTPTDINFTTPAFTGLSQTGPTTVELVVVIGTTTLTAPNCFTYTASGPFISQCSNPNTGPVNGGTAMTITGGNFGSNVAAIQVSFSANGETEQGTVTGAAGTTISVTTPAFTTLDPRVKTNADLTLTIAGKGSVTEHACFGYAGTTAVPVVTAISPASGTKLGSTRATIFGNNFEPFLQVFIGDPTLGATAPVQSITPTQIIILTPPDSAPLSPSGGNDSNSVTVRNANCLLSGSTPCQSDGVVTFTYLGAPRIISSSPTKGDFTTPVTIDGSGFVCPVVVAFGDTPGSVLSCTGTQILAVPQKACGAGGAISVTNSTGDTASGSNFKIVQTAITAGPFPAKADFSAPFTVTLQGTELFHNAGTLPSTDASCTAAGDLEVCVDIGTVQITAESGDPITSESVTLQITVPQPCGVSGVNLTFTNLSTNCVTPTRSVGNNAQALQAAFTFTAGSGHQLTFSATPTGGVPPYTYQWTFLGQSNSVTGTPPNPASSTLAAPSVTWDCGASTPACTVAATATLTVTDKCGTKATVGPLPVSPP